MVSNLTFLSLIILLGCICILSNYAARWDHRDRSSSESSQEDDDERTAEKLTGHIRMTHNRHRGTKQQSMSRNKDSSAQWKPWEESECLWVDQIRSIPDSCGLDQMVKKLPHLLSHYYASRALETFETIQRIYKKRGLTDQGCGHCSRKIACRQRLRNSKINFFPAELAFVNDDCDNGDPCRISAINGNCPAPVKQKYFALYNLLSSVKHLDEESVDDNSENGDEDARSHFLASDPRLFGWPKDDRSYSADITVNETIEYVRRTLVVTKNSRARPLKGRIDQTGNLKRYSYEIPLWRCIRDPAADDKCLCCCGDYYPDASSGECVPVRNGNSYPPIDIEY